MNHKLYRTGAAIAIAASMLIGMLALLYTPGAAAPAAKAAVSVSPDHTEIISKAMAYLATQQAADGGFGDEFSTIRAVLGTAAVHYPVLETITGTTPLDYLAARAVTYTHAMTGTGPLNPGRAGALLAAVVAANGDPTSFGGMDLVQELSDSYNPATGAFSTTATVASPLTQWWSIIGMAAAPKKVPVSATNYLADMQRADGGWAWGTTAPSSDPDSTAFALLALLASGNVDPQDTMVLNGLQYLADIQHSSGGWDMWGAVSADTTAAAIQAYTAAGYTPVTHMLRNSAGKTPHDALIALQQTDGSFAGYSPIISTADALMGLAEAPLPIFGYAGRANLALSWMQTQLLPNNAWPSDYGGSSTGGTIDVVLAYASAGYSPTTVHASGTTTSPLDYLASQATAYATGPDSAGKLVAAVAASGLDPEAFGGVNLIEKLTTDYYSTTLSAFGAPTNTWHQALGILGLTGAGETLPAGVTDTLKGLQQPDGGWKYDLSPSPWNTTSVDNTALAMQALIAAGVNPSDTAIVSATAYLKANQSAEGGWAGWSGLSANTTAFAIQALAAAGEDLTGNAWCDGTACPLTALASLQKQDGPFVSGMTDNYYATQQAVPGLLAVPFPVTNGALIGFVPVNTGFDPDQLFVSGDPEIVWGNSMTVTLSFGSDLDQDGVAALDYRVRGDVDWITGTTVQRENGLFYATIPVTKKVDYEVQINLTDIDDIVYGTQSSQTLTLTASINFVYLPLILK